MSRSDIVVVGAGVFGAWIALSAARAGHSVTLIDQLGPANPRSGSSGETRIIRSAYGPDAIYSVMAQRSLQLWTQFLNEQRCREYFQNTGVLWLADAAHPALSQAHTIFRELGLTHEWLDHDALAARYPQMRVSSNTAALLEPDAGALLAERSVTAVVKAAVQSGVRYETTRFDSVDANGSVYVFAIGSWLPKLFPDLLGHVIRATRQELFFFEPPQGADQFEPSKLPIWIDETESRIAYGLPDLGAGMKMGFHRLGPAFDPETGEREIAASQIAEAAEYLAQRFPAMKDAAFKSARVCHYDNTPNGDFLIDRHPHKENIWFAGGGSGHGFKHAPAVAEYVIAAIASGRSPEPRFTLAAKQAAAGRRVL